MPLRKYLGDGCAFGPDDLEAMTSAFEATLNELGLKDRTDGAVELVAKKIIALAKQGERDPIKLCQRALSSLRDDPTAAA